VYRFISHTRFCSLEQVHVGLSEIKKEIIKMSSLKKIFATSLALAASIYAAERVYMAPFNMIGLNENFALPAEKLLTTYIEDNKDLILVNYSEEDSIKAGDREAANKKAIEKKCSKFIITEFTRLGENVITSFKLYDVNNESAVWSDRLKAKNPDDFDPIIQRVARNIGTKNKATDDDDIYSVTEQETKSPKKKGTTAYLGGQITGMLSVNPDARFDGGFGVFLLYDAKNCWFGFDWSINNLDSKNSEKPTLSGLTLSAYYPFGTKNITPFIGGGLTYSRRTLEIDTEKYRDYKDDDELVASGITGEFGGGVLLNRASRVMFLIQAKYFVDFFESPTVDYKPTKTGTDVAVKNYYLNGFKFSLGLGFGI